MVCNLFAILTFIDTGHQQVTVADSFKKNFFFGPCQPQKFEINNFFLLTSSVLLRVIFGLITGKIWSSEGEIIKSYPMITKK